MNWIDAIRQGGAWVLAVGIGWAVLTGKLRLSREVEDLVAVILQLRSEKSELAAELKATALKAESTLMAEQEATRSELAELRKTNAALVESLSSARSVS